MNEEICFFKYYKPALTGRLLYYIKSRVVAFDVKRLLRHITKGR